METDIRTFMHDFGGGIRCQVSIDINHPHGSKDFMWDGKPTRAVIPEYRKWMHTVNQKIADGIEGKVLWILHSGKRRWEYWSYTPGMRRPRLLKKARRAPSLHDTLTRDIENWQ
jgi:hypothetical protein